MPNWCHNTLDVTGRPDRVAEFQEANSTPDQPLTFAAAAPEPPGDDDDCLQFHLVHWGTKWDAVFSTDRTLAFGAEGMDVQASGAALGVQGSAETRVYQFDTAWSPPLAWLVHASDQWPDLTFHLRFGEPGNDFAGEATRCVEEDVSEYTELKVTDVLAPEQMWF
jgi:hypothetical protein